MNEELLQRYTDLSLERLDALRQAQTGTLTRMNGAMREAMKDLINPDHTITEWGEVVLEKANLILNDRWGIIHYESRPWVTESSVSAAAKMRELTNYAWLRSRHAKLLKILWDHPGLTYHFLGVVFGYSCLAEMDKQQGFLLLDQRMGAWVGLGPVSVEIILDSGLVAPLP